MVRINVRAAIPGDIAAITGIYRPAVLDGTASFEIEPPDWAEMSGRMAAIVDGGYPYLVAVGDAGVIGYGYAGAYRPRPAYRWTVEDSIYLAPAAQGQGAGRLLLEALIAETTRLGFRQMVAVIGDTASVASIRLHTACGFQPCGTVKAVGYKHGRWLDQVILQRALGTGDNAPPLS